jgi:hypothetical protein
MKIRTASAAAALLWLALPAAANAQDTQENQPPAWTPPRMLVLAHQEIKSGKAVERRQLEISSARAFDRLEVPVHFVVMQGLTGTGDSLALDPFDSYADIEKAVKALGSLYAAHPEVNRIQQSIDELIAGSKTVIAILRDDLSPRAVEADESKARFMRVTVIHLRPGREADFSDTGSQAPSLVYQVEAGTSEPTLIILEPMHKLEEADAARAPEASEKVQAAIVSRESNLYMISPEMSHVGKAFAAGDPGFWSVAPEGKKASASNEAKKSPPTQR